MLINQLCILITLMLNAFYKLYQYVDQSVSVKACAGLNGMKLGGKVLTVLQAVHGAASLVQ